MRFPFHAWLLRQDAQRQREARIFIAGFWTGLAPGFSISLGCVFLALWLRG